MRDKLLILGFMAAFWAAAGTYADGGVPNIRIKLAEDSTIMTTHFQVADIAEVRSADQELAERIEGITINRVPRTGHSMYITRHMLAALVEHVIPGSYRRILFSGATAARIHGGGVSFAGVEIEREARATLTKWLGNSYDNYEIRPSSNIKDVTLPDGRVTMTADIAGGDRLPREMCVRVDISIDGKHYQTVPVWFSISVYLPVLVARHELVKGRVPDESDFKAVVNDITGMNAAPLQSLSDAGSYRTRRTIRQGEVIFVDDLEKIPDVIAGQRVTVISDSGKVRIQTVGIALADGDQSDKVDIRAINGGAVYPAVVTGRGSVIATGTDIVMNRLLILLPLLLFSNLSMAGSLFSDDTYEPLVSDPRSYKVGQSVTVLILEEASAKTSADTTTNKDVSVGGSVSGGNNTPVDKFAGNFDFNNDYKGGGSVNREGKLVARISVTVTEVLPSGELRIFGEQSITFNDEDQHIRVSGKIRPQDISSANTILSSRIADADITYVGNGVIAKGQKPGLLTRFFNWLF